MGTRPMSWVLASEPKIKLLNLLAVTFLLFPLICLRNLNPQMCKFLESWIPMYPPISKVATDEKSFRWALNEDEMAENKLAEGIRKFAADLVKLENEVKEKIEEIPSPLK